MENLFKKNRLIIDSIGCEKAVLHQVIRTAKQKQLFMFLYWLGLLPQMQAFLNTVYQEVVKEVVNFKK